MVKIFEKQPILYVEAVFIWNIREASTYDQQNLHKTSYSPSKAVLHSSNPLGNMKESFHITCFGDRDLWE